MFRTIALTGFAALVAASTISLAPPARAQIGNIFSDPAPRPPGSDSPRQQQQQPQPDDEEEVPELPRGRLLPTPNRPPPGQGVPPPGSVQSQPLAPPPGTTVVPQNTPPGIAVAPPQPGQGVAVAPPGANPLPGLPPGQRQPKSVPQTPATLQPGDEVVSEPPAQKIVNKKASFSGLDKITGRIINFDEDIGETVQFGALRVKTDACYTRPATEAANTDAFVEVDEITLQGEVKRIFSGWMYAASPGLHGVEHPIYDIWLTDCKGPDTTIVSAQPDPPKPAPPAAQKRPPPQKQAAPRPSPPPQPQFQQQPPPPAAAQQQQPGGLFGIFRRNLARIEYAPCAAHVARSRDNLASASRAADADAHRSGRPSAEIRRLARDRLVEQRGVAPPRNLDRAEAAQMLGDILRVEQFEAARDQPRHQMHQRHLRGVAGAMKHALAEERAAEADAVQAADQIVILPDLDAVAMPELVQPDIEIADALVDPGVVAAGLRRGTAGDHRLEGGVDGDGEGVGAHRARQARGDAKAVERDHAAHFRLDPEQGRIVGAFGHREDAAGIGAQQHFGRDVGRGGVARRHGREDSRAEGGDG